MASRLVRLIPVLLATGLLGTMLGSTAPQSVGASEARRPMLAAPPAELLSRRPDRVPSAVPSPTKPISPMPTIRARITASLRPLPTPAVTAQEVVLVNLDTGRVLWQFNGGASWAPASLTKIFTAMVAVDLMGMDTTVTVPGSITELPADSTLMGLTPGERVTVRDLLYGVFLNSGNDAAETLASAVTSRPRFIADMNAKAVRLGLRHTHFLNPTGLDAGGHSSTATELAAAAVYLEYHYGGLVAIAATPAITIPATPTHKGFRLSNLDKLMKTYPGTYGLKTGWTEAAMGCLITTSRRGGHRLLAVMLGAPNGTAYAQMPEVLDYGFELLGVLARPPVS